jgi:serine/threonine protein phosphatase PrpC
VRSECAYYGVYDGHNGSNCSEFLLQHFHLEVGKRIVPLLDSAESTETVVDAVRDALGQACSYVDMQICAELRQARANGGACALFALLFRCGQVHVEAGLSNHTADAGVHGRRDAILVVGNVGDSRCVLCRGGKAIALTKEQRVTRPVSVCVFVCLDSTSSVTHHVLRCTQDERERVKLSGGFIVNDRVNGSLVVSRSFGDIEYKGLGSETTIQDMLLQQQQDNPGGAAVEVTKASPRKVI